MNRRIITPVTEEELPQEDNSLVITETVKTKPKKQTSTKKARVNFVLEQEYIDKIEALANEMYEGNISLVYRKVIKESDLLEGY